MQAILAWCRDSETILIARLKFIVGTLGQVLLQADPAPLFALAHIDPKWLPLWQVFAAYLMADGILSEWARRRRATDL